MTIKVKTERAWADRDEIGFLYDEKPRGGNFKAVRVVDESDWRKVMAVVREADWCVRNIRGATDSVLENAVVALRKHLEKRK